MKTWTPDEVDPEFDLTPMIDVVFLLIAFFMTLISFISAELIDLELPEAERASIPEDPGERQYISLTVDGSIYLGATPTTYEEIPGILSDRMQKIPSIKVFLRADANTPHRYVNKVMEACAQAGIFNLIFASSKD
ncbi:MAG: biopolymer transport protein ExbD [Lentimonas sp.]|jgi:biopolymer transport protein ExbD